jgi:hypothetical protein
MRPFSVDKMRRQLGRDLEPPAPPLSRDEVFRRLVKAVPAAGVSWHRIRWPTRSTPSVP